LDEAVTAGGVWAFAGTIKRGDDIITNTTRVIERLNDPFLFMALIFNFYLNRGLIAIPDFDIYFEFAWPEPFQGRAWGSRLAARWQSMHLGEAS
jgi:hypothetical protein